MSVYSSASIFTYHPITKHLPEDSRHFIGNVLVPSCLEMSPAGGSHTLSHHQSMSSCLDFQCLLFPWLCPQSQPILKKAISPLSGSPWSMRPMGGLVFSKKTCPLFFPEIVAQIDSFLISFLWWLGFWYVTSDPLSPSLSLFAKVLQSLLSLSSSVIIDKGRVSHFWPNMSLFTRSLWVQIKWKKVTGALEPTPATRPIWSVK